EEVYGMLGALLGTLEVVATDDSSPLAPLQVERMRSAVKLCYRLQHQVEALLTLAADGLALRLHDVALRPLVEHALHGAVRGLSAPGVTLRLPTADDWGMQRVRVDPSRTDRMLQALTESLLAGLGQDGVLELAVHARGEHVELTLVGQPGTPLESKRQQHGEPTLEGSTLLTRAAQRLFEQLGGSCSVDATGLRLQIALCTSEAP
ncbi:MAG: hypothetical protein JWN04_6829, partial [Myxococcaceae bacterium]|nr:hypothetical protein [Myxococcaceae bacterium]